MYTLDNVGVFTKGIFWLSTVFTKTVKWWWAKSVFPTLLLFAILIVLTKFFLFVKCFGIKSTFMARFVFADLEFLFKGSSGSGSGSWQNLNVWRCKKCTLLLWFIWLSKWFLANYENLPTIQIWSCLKFCYYKDSVLFGASDNKVLEYSRVLKILTKNCFDAWQILEGNKFILLNRS